MWDGEDNPESSIEHLRFSHQKQMGQFFGRLGMQGSLEEVGAGNPSMKYLMSDLMNPEEFPAAMSQSKVCQEGAERPSFDLGPN